MKSSLTPNLQPDNKGNDSNRLQWVVAPIYDVEADTALDPQLQIRLHDNLNEKVQTSSCTEYCQISDQDRLVRTGVSIDLLGLHGHNMSISMARQLSTRIFGRRRISKHPKSASAVSFLYNIFTTKRGDGTLGINGRTSEDATFHLEAFSFSVAV